MRKSTGPALIFALIAFFVASPAPAQDVSEEEAEAISQKIQESHIAANVPPEEDFDDLLRKDLSAYFATSDQPAPHAVFEPLRFGPTQTGIAYPKFYVWVQVDSATPREGALSVAAIDRTRFKVIEFVDRQQIENDPSCLDGKFPIPVADAIKRRAADAAR